MNELANKQPPFSCCQTTATFSETAPSPYASLYLVEVGECASWPPIHTEMNSLWHQKRRDFYMNDITKISQESEMSLFVRQTFSLTSRTMCTAGQTISQPLLLAQAGHYWGCRAGTAHSCKYQLPKNVASLHRPEAYLSTVVRKCDRF